MGLVGDHIYFQGHAAPGVYARAYLEGRLSEPELDNFRMEVGGNGLPSYPHPRLMPDFWEYPTVSMGLGPINSIYHARFNRYIHHRRIDDTSASTVWCFLGDGSATSPRPWAPSPSPAATAWTTSTGWSTATCSASTARCGATARSSRSSRACSGARAGT